MAKHWRKFRWRNLPGCYEARTVVGSYRVYYAMQGAKCGYCVRFPNQNLVEYLPTLAEAKRLARLDYEARLFLPAPPAKEGR